MFLLPAAVTAGPHAVAAPPTPPALPASDQARVPLSGAAAEAGSPLRPVDARALAQVRGRLGRAGRLPWLHEEAARRMAERLAFIRRTPATVLEWGPRLGGGSQALDAAYPHAQRLRVEWEEVLAGEGLRREPRGIWRRWFAPSRVAEPAPALHPWQLPAQGVQLLWASMVLHGVADPPALLRAWQRALAVDGFLMCCTLGPGTLPELRAIYREAGWGAPGAALVDMHDLGDMMVAAGLADPVMDQELLTLTFADARSALEELRGLGGNVDPGRHPGLRTPRWRARLLEALAASARGRADGRVALSFELVYGHAFQAEPALKVSERTAFSPEALQRMARGGRRRPP